MRTINFSRSISHQVPLSPVQSGVLMLSELVDDRLDAQHQELVPEVEAELQVVLEIKRDRKREGEGVIL